MGCWPKGQFSSRRVGSKTVVWSAYKLHELSLTAATLQTWILAHVLVQALRKSVTLTWPLPEHEGSSASESQSVIQRQRMASLSPAVGVRPSTERHQVANGSCSPKTLEVGGALNLG